MPGGAKVCVPIGFFPSERTSGDREDHDKDQSRQRRRYERSTVSCQHEAEISRVPADPVESFGHEPAGFLERVDIGVDSLELNLPGHRIADTENDESRPGPGKPGLDEPEQRVCS